MNKITFGFSEIRKKTPDFIVHVLAASATILAVAKGLNMIYPRLVTTDVVSWISDALAAMGIIAPLFGIKTIPTTDKPTE